MKLLCLIPARSGSKRVPDKNIRVLGGKPLMQWTIETAKECGIFDKIIVSSDSKVYLDMARSCGVEGILRPPELAEDGSTDVDLMKHALETLQDVPGQENGFVPKIVVYLRPTTAYRETSVILEAIRTFCQHSEATSLRSVEEMTESAYKSYEIMNGVLYPVQGSTLYESNLPNQMLTKTYRGNGYVDILRRADWGDRILGFVTPQVIEIDTEFDFWLAEQWLRKEEK